MIKHSVGLCEKGRKMIDIQSNLRGKKERSMRFLLPA
tara:strand:- start:492 stop:602 length:111 start_codon:yes stop_codon:yes gene_type:complete